MKFIPSYKDVFSCSPRCVSFLHCSLYEESSHCGLQFTSIQNVMIGTDFKTIVHWYFK